MNVSDKALSSMVTGILKAIALNINNAKFNKGITGRVTEILGNNIYVVNINNKSYKAKSKLLLQINDVVKIICWNNDMNELYIIY